MIPLTALKTEKKERKKGCALPSARGLLVMLQTHITLHNTAAWATEIACGTDREKRSPSTAVLMEKNLQAEAETDPEKQAQDGVNSDHLPLKQRPSGRQSGRCSHLQQVGPEGQSDSLRARVKYKPDTRKESARTEGDVGDANPWTNFSARGDSACMISA